MITQMPVWCRGPSYKPFVSYDEVELVMGMDAVQKARPDWRESFTLWSGGPLNINEAPPDLIAAVFSLDASRVGFFTSARNGRGWHCRNFG